MNEEREAATGEEPTAAKNHEASISVANPQLEILERRLNEIGRLITLAPGKPNTKTPAVEGWADEATWPPGKCVLGREVTCVCLSQCGVFVVDCDNEEAISWFVNTFQPPDTLTVATKRGAHFYFQQPTDFEVHSATGLGHPKLDIKGWHSEVVAPGSPGKVVAVDVQIARAPENLLAHLRRPAPAAAPSMVPALDVTGEKGKARVVEATEYLKSCDPSIDGQGGDTVLWSVSRHLMRSLELPIESALPMMLDIFNPRCQPPWSAGVIERNLTRARDDSTTPTATDVERGRALVNHLVHDLHPMAGVPAPPEPRTMITSPADWLRSLVERGKAPRIETGFPTLDAATRGGYQLGKLIAVGGAPGAAKTGMVVTMAQIWGAQRPVVVVAADEEAHGLGIRLGQQVGFDRDKLEVGDPEECARAAEAIQRLSPRLELIDPNASGLCLEDIADRLTEPTIVIVDSLQAIRVRGSERASDRRAAIDAALEVAKTIRRAGHLIIVTCELARSAYRSADASLNTNPLAAFKESGGIEYAVDQALVLISRKGSGTIVDVVMPKNRLGPKMDFALQLDFARATVCECNLPAALFDPLAKSKQRVMNWVTDNSRHLPLSKTSLAEQAGGMQKQTREAINALLEEGLLAQDRALHVTLPHEVLAQMSGIPS